MDENKTPPLTEEMLRKALEPQPYQPIPKAIRDFYERVAKPWAEWLANKERG